MHRPSLAEFASSIATSANKAIRDAVQGIDDATQPYALSLTSDAGRFDGQCRTGDAMTCDAGST